MLIFNQIKKIEGVFSGTLSYIFNEFSTANPEGPSFSSVVRVAKEKGYTVRLLIICKSSTDMNALGCRNLTLEMISTERMYAASSASLPGPSPTSKTRFQKATSRSPTARWCHPHLNPSPQVPSS